MINLKSSTFIRLTYLLEQILSLGRQNNGSLLIKLLDYVFQAICEAMLKMKGLKHSMLEKEMKITNKTGLI